MKESTQCAVAIRKDLKASFPNIKFSVTSSSYAGGNKVDVSYADGVAEAKVKAIVGKYEYGEFNSMQDIYETTNCRNDMPQVRYLFIHRNYSEDVTKKTKEAEAKRFGVNNIEDENEWDQKTGRYSYNAVYKSLKEVDL